MNRRDFWSTGAAAAALGAFATEVLAGNEATFRFVHLTDTHIQPELRAGEGCRMCFDKVNTIHPNFILHGGDLVFDAAQVGPQRATAVYDLYAEASKRLEAKVHTVVGNHDIFGVTPASGVKPDSWQYGKRMFEDRVGKRFYRFEHKGWQFIGLDSIYLTQERSFVGRIDDEQLTWLSGELGKLPQGSPVIVTTHMPLVTAFPQYAAASHRMTS